MHACPQAAIQNRNAHKHWLRFEIAAMDTYISQTRKQASIDFYIFLHLRISLPRPVLTAIIDDDDEGDDTQSKSCIDRLF